ncbi:putative circularly permutated Ras protein 1 [Apostichopus japonicus]|uniref:Putative circularly permutated Ras protein 1 n=1 Tax=Stichopus japonicus TaxID=307972 RepID=A0A2G8K2P5_STIJA|nr:putative circularly permutated Ras protein 1 [Apostichopus japonicus]
MRLGQAFVIVYSIDDKNSFQAALDIHTLAKRIKGTSFSAILCGNKSDLESERQVPAADGEKEAKARDMAFMETSAKTGEKVTLAFEELIRRTIRTGIEYRVVSRRYLNVKGLNGSHRYDVKCIKTLCLFTHAATVPSSV